MVKMKTAFVIMPFSGTSSCTESEWTDLFTEVFKPSIESCGYSCERAMPETGSLIRSILEKLRNSSLVVADITDRNANVFYELGVRHSLSKRTIIITQDNAHVPSDLTGYWFINYGTTPGKIKKFKEEIKQVMASIERNPEKNDNPVAEFLEQENLSISNFVDKQNLKKLSALYTEFSGNIIELSTLRNPSVSPTHISTECLKILLHTLYLDPGEELLKRFYEYQNRLKMIDNDRSGLDSLITETKRLAEEILDVRNRIANNEYFEPSRVSLMMWQPNSEDSGEKCAPVADNTVIHLAPGHGKSIGFLCPKCAAVIPGDSRRENGDIVCPSCNAVSLPGIQDR
jgi:hypothetical protein